MVPRGDRKARTALEAATSPRRSAPAGVTTRSARLWAERRGGAGSAPRAGDPARLSRVDLPARSTPRRTTSTRPGARRTRPAAGDKPRVVILGSGPNRIGQGSSSTTAACTRRRRSRARLRGGHGQLQSRDRLDRLRHLRPPLLRAAFPEEVLAVCDREQPLGVVTQFGGQTPLRLARAIEEGGYRILGTPHEAIDLAEDRERFGPRREDVSAVCPPWAIVSDRPRRSTQSTRSATRCSCVRPTCSAAARCGSATTRSSSRPRWRRSRKRPSRPLRRERDRARRRRALRRRRRLHRCRHAARRGGGRALGDSACVLRRRR